MEGGARFEPAQSKIPGLQFMGIFARPGKTRCHFAANEILVAARDGFEAGGIESDAGGGEVADDLSECGFDLGRLG